MDAALRPSMSPALALGRAAASVVSSLMRPAAHDPAMMPAVMMRAGTSKGLFVHRRHLPHSKGQWARILSTAMGSSHADKRQLDGLGGASSTTSKAAIISPSRRPDADVDYTFAQIAVGQNKVDLKGSCGNICSGVGAFALDEGLVRVAPYAERALVRVHDTNTGAIIEQSVRVTPTGRFDSAGNHIISGYAGAGSPIELAWKDAAGTVGRRLLFPTGNPADTIAVQHTHISPHPFKVSASLVDASNPFVFVDARTLPPHLQMRPADDPELTAAAEAIRREAAVMYGLASSAAEAATTRAIPKIALLRPPLAPSSGGEQDMSDINVTAYTMGKPHPSFQLTGVLCLSVALSHPGTVASIMSREARGLAPLAEAERGAVHKRIQHPAGVAEAVVRNKAEGDSGAVKLESVGVVTTAARLFKGDVYVGRREDD